MAVTADGAALTSAHRAAQAQIAASVIALVRAAWPLLDARDLDASVRRWSSVVLPLILDGRDRSAQTAALYLRAFASAEANAPIEVSLDQTPAASAAVATSLRVTGPVTIKSLISTGVGRSKATQTALTSVLGSAQRHVLDGGRQTIDRTVMADRRVRGYARVTSGSACSFCAMLASRGPVYKSERTAGDQYHDACGCSAEPVYAGAWSNPNGARADELAELWKSSTRGLTGDEARNAFRRAYSGASTTT